MKAEEITLIQSALIHLIAILKTKLEEYTIPFLIEMTKGELTEAEEALEAARRLS